MPCVTHTTHNLVDRSDGSANDSSRDPTLPRPSNGGRCYTDDDDDMACPSNEELGNQDRCKSHLTGAEETPGGTGATRRPFTHGGRIFEDEDSDDDECPLWVSGEVLRRDNNRRGLVFDTDGEADDERDDTADTADPSGFEPGPEFQIDHDGANMRETSQGQARITNDFFVQRALYVIFAMLTLTTLPVFALRTAQNSHRTAQPTAAWPTVYKCCITQTD